VVEELTDGLVVRDFHLGKLRHRYCGAEPGETVTPGRMQMFDAKPFDEPTCMSALSLGHIRLSCHRLAPRVNRLCRAKNE
jgi:hypothetical protein